MGTMDEIKAVVSQLSPNEQESLRAWLDELTSVSNSRLELTPDEVKLLAQGRDDIKHGRTSSLAETSADLDDFFAALRANATKL
jgi:hypothetical protein